MKNKKLLAAIVAVTMSATTAFAFAGCDTNKHTHDYTDWTVTTPPTCTEDGEETGTCKADGATSTRPVDALGHKYGDWQIFTPTAERGGSARKVCANNANHSILVALPVLPTSGRGPYSNVQTLKEEPTYTQKEYTYTSIEHGDIKFTVDEANKDVNLTVADAVKTASDAKYVSLVGKGEGYYSSYGEQNPFLYEYGDNYTHIKDENAVEQNFEFWGDKDAQGNISGGIYKDWNYNWINEETAVYFDGMIFTSPVLLGDGEDDEEKYQGIENYLAALYAAATTEVSDAGYNHNLKEESNEGKYSFSFTVYNQLYNSYLNAAKDDYENLNIFDNLYLVSVEFSLDANYMLDSFKLSVDTYSYYYSYEEGGNLAYTYDEATDTFIPKADANLDFNYDATTKTYSVKDGDSDAIRNEISLTQTALKDIEKLPVNDFKRDEVSVSSFDVLTGIEVTEEEWNAADENEYVKKIEQYYSYEIWDNVTAYMLYTKVNSGATLNGTTASGLKLVLDGIAPESALEYMSLNPARAYLIEGGKETLIYSNVYAEQDSISEDYTDYTKKKENLQVLFNNETEWNDETGLEEFKSAYFTLRSEQKIGDFKVKLTFGEIEFNLTYHVDVATPDSVSTTVKEYSEVTNDYRDNTSSNVTVYVGQKLNFVVNAGAPVGESYLVDSRAMVILASGEQTATLESNADGSYTFTATATGNYLINVKSLVNEEATCELRITVEEAPDVTAMLTGNYDAGKFSISFNSDNTVTVTGGVEPATFGYTYENGVLTAASTDGNYSIVLTENYKLALVSKDEFGETNWAVFKAPENEDVKAIKAALANGEWSGKYQYYDEWLVTDRFTLTFTTDGKVVFGDIYAMDPPEFSYSIIDNGDGTYAIAFDVTNAAFSYNYQVMEVDVALTVNKTEGSLTIGNKITVVIYDMYAGPQNIEFTQA